MSSSRITIIGATSGPGRSLLLRLAEMGSTVQGIGRRAEKIAALSAKIAGTNASIVGIDVTRDQSFLADTDILIHCSQPVLTKYLISDNLSQFIALGSTRKFTRYPDQRCHDVNIMEQMAMQSAVPTTILHPTLIYGGDGLDNVERIIDTARKIPLIPLPASGMSLIQPIHCDDVVDAIISSMNNEAVLDRSIVLAGPSPMTYRTFVTKTIQAMSLRSRVITVPYHLVVTLAAITRWLPGLPAIDSAEVQRLLEDKHFDTLDMRNLLNLLPRGFDEGIGQYAAQLKTEVRG
jgi:nucleoside-diphosphate-sugar epimerase